MNEQLFDLFRNSDGTRLATGTMAEVRRWKELHEWALIDCHIVVAT